VIRIPISYGDFNDFWQSYSVPDGPSGQAIRKMSPSKIEQLKRRLREQLPTGPDGRITYDRSLFLGRRRTGRAHGLANPLFEVKRIKIKRCNQIATVAAIFAVLSTNRVCLLAA